MEHLVIIGNGISGITTAINVRKISDIKITVISAETKYFFSRTALMYIFMGHMKFEHTKPYEDWFWKKNKIDLVYGKATSINTDNNLVCLENGQCITYDKLVVSTGSVSNKFGWSMAAVLGILQRKKPRFRIRTNGSQCISCGNCSTYCEMGIDVRSYAQKQQNIVRASCVGCGICSEVCPRGVLKLENDFADIRYNP